MWEEFAGERNVLLGTDSCFQDWDHTDGHFKTVFKIEITLMEITCLLSSSQEPSKCLLICSSWSYCSFKSVSSSCNFTMEIKWNEIWNNNEIKYSIAHLSLKPIYKILNPNLAFNCPKDQRLFSALDAFCQSIESYWSKGATYRSKKYAIKALKLINENLISGLLRNDFNSILERSD